MAGWMDGWMDGWMNDNEDDDAADDDDDDDDDELFNPLSFLGHPAFFTSFHSLISRANQVI